LESVQEGFDLLFDLANSSAKVLSEGEMQGIDPGTLVLPQVWLPQ
jgi:hypothetical protein